MTSHLSFTHLSFCMPNKEIQRKEAWHLIFFLPSSYSRIGKSRESLLSFSLLIPYPYYSQGAIQIPVFSILFGSSQSGSLHTLLIFFFVWNKGWSHFNPCNHSIKQMQVGFELLTSYTLVKRFYHYAMVILATIDIF